MNLRNKKTGKLYEWCSIMVKKNRKSVKLLVAEKEDDDREIYYYESFEKMCEEWETVEDPQPKEPLIKDEKIRKAVRAWAEANGIERVWHECASCWLRGNGLSIEMENEVDELEQGNYTITELCGEEE